MGTGSTHRGALRLVLSLVLIVVLLYTSWRVDARFLFRTTLLVIGLIAVYSFIHLLVTCWFLGLRSWPAAVVANALLVAVYLVGGPSGLLLGRGEGELAAGALLGVSLLLAAVRGDAGCKLTSIPAALFGKRSQLACIVFSPIDWLERKLRGDTQDLTNLKLRALH